MNDKLSFGKVFVLGFALFAMFFGAGNLIFPPALGIVTGTNWMISFLVYILADAGLAILALLAFFRCQEGFQNSISIQLDKTTSFLLILFNTLCIGPFIAIPRTAATTFDIAVKPLFGPARWWTSSARSCPRPCSWRCWCSSASASFGLWARWPPAPPPWRP